jgi:hypothetical protein
MNIKTQIFASRLCSPSPPPSSRRWRGVSAILSEIRFNGTKPNKTDVWLRRKASAPCRQSDASVGARYRDRPDLTATIKST